MSLSADLDAANTALIEAQSARDSAQEQVAECTEKWVGAKAEKGRERLLKAVVSAHARFKAARLQVLLAQNVVGDLRAHLLLTEEPLLHTTVHINSVSGLYVDVRKRECVRALSPQGGFRVVDVDSTEELLKGFFAAYDARRDGGALLAAQTPWCSLEELSDKRGNWLYICLCVTNGMVYVGKTVASVRTRFSEHRSKARTHIDRALLDAGLHFALTAYDVANLADTNELLHIERLCWEWLAYAGVRLYNVLPASFSVQGCHVLLQDVEQKAQGQD